MKTLMKSALLSFIGLTFWADFAYAATLKQDATIEADVIKVEDVFEDAGKYGDRVITRAPAPGKKITFDLKVLSKIARSYRVEWAPTSRYDKITFQRSSLLITTDHIKDSLRTHLVNEDKALMPGAHELVVELDNRTLSWHLPTDTETTIAIQNFSFDPVSKRFSALMVSPATGETLVRQNVTGKAISMIEVPVFAETMRAGDIIAENDLDWVEVAYDRRVARALVKAEEIVGKTPRRSIMAGQPLRPTDLEEPNVISRNETVIIRIKAGALTVTARGRALHDAAKGETVRVTNTQSNKTIEGIASGFGEVTIGTVLASPSY